jgi:hypothetical protein
MTQLIQREYSKSALGEANYNADAQIVSCRYDVFTSEAQSPTSKEDVSGHQCDLCGVAMPADRLHSADGNVQLCDRCYRQYLCIPQGKIRQCLQRFLMGNVI